MRDLLLRMFVVSLATATFVCGPRSSPDAPVTANFTAFEDEPSGLWGYRDQAGRVVIQPRYVMAQDFARGAGTAIDADGWALIDPTGAVLLRPFNFDNGPDPFEEGLARYVDSAGRFGFYDETGKIVIPARFDFAGQFEDGAAPVCMECKLIPEGEHRRVSGGRWGRINRAGEFITPLGAVEP